MASVTDIANFFIDASLSQKEDFLTNMKLNKLMYYAQAWCLVRYGKPLFKETICAWKHGPVIPRVYNIYKPFISQPITIMKDPSYIYSLSQEEEEILIDVMLNYGKLTASALVNKTHVPGGPWEQTEQMKEIPQELIKAYFDSCPPMPSARDLIAKSKGAITPKRREDGLALIPRELVDDWC